MRNRLSKYLDQDKIHIHMYINRIYSFFIRITDTKTWQNMYRYVLQAAKKNVK